MWRIHTRCSKSSPSQLFDGELGKAVGSTHASATGETLRATILLSHQFSFALSINALT